MCLRRVEAAMSHVDEELDEVGRAELGDGVGRLVLFANSRDFHPGEVIRGSVKLQLQCVPFLVRGIWVKLVGVNKVLPVTVEDGVSDEGASFNVLQGEEDFEHDGLSEVLIGFGETVHDEESDMLEFNELSYEWTFSLKIPEDAPMSYCDDYVQMLYSLHATIDSPMVPNSAGQISFSIVVGSLFDSSESLSCPDAASRANLGGGTTATELALENGALVAPNTHAPTALRNETTSSIRTSIARFLRGRVYPKNAMYLQLEVGETATAAPAEFTFEESFFDVPLKACFSDIPRGYKRAKLIITLHLEISTRPSPYSSFSAYRENETSNFSKRRGAKMGRGLTGRIFGKSKSRAILHVKPRVYRTKIWQTERLLDLDPVLLSSSGSDEATEIFTMPMAIDPYERKRSLREWPYPQSLTHKLEEGTARLLTFGCEGPLSKVRYILTCEMTASRQPRSRRTGEINFTRLESCEKEIVVLPPRSTRNYDSASLPISRDGGIQAAPTSASVVAGQFCGTAGRMGVHQTPHAKKAPVRVVGEIISRGPAAVLVDRGGRVAVSQSTPESFAPLRHVSNQDVTCLLDTPIFSPALAYVCNSVPQVSVETPRDVLVSPRVGHGSGAIPRGAHTPFHVGTYQGLLSSMTNTQFVESETHQSTTEDNYPRVSSGDTDRSPTREEDIIINRGGESVEGDHFRHDIGQAPSEGTPSFSAAFNTNMAFGSTHSPGGTGDTTSALSSPTSSRAPLQTPDSFMMNQIASTPLSRDDEDVDSMRSLGTDTISCSSSPATVNTEALLLTASQQEEHEQQLTQSQSLFSRENVTPSCAHHRCEVEEEEDRTEVLATPSTRDESLLASPATTNETSGTPNRASMQCDFEVSGGGASLIPLLTLSEVTSSLWEAQENDGDVMTWIVECKRRGSFPPLCSTEQCVKFLSCIKLSSVRECALLWLAREKMLTEQVEEAIFDESGPVEQCFGLEVERERVKAQIRMEMLAIQ